MPAIEEKRAVLVKIESSYGVDPTATGAANAVLCYLRAWRPQMPVYASRAGLAVPALGQFASKTAVQWAGIDLEVELTGAAAAGTAPPYGPLLRACGMSETIVGGVSVTYAPISAAFESVAVVPNIDGMQQLLLGSRGSWGLSLRNDEIPMFRFGMTSKYASPTDTALPSLTLTAHQEPQPVNRTNTPTVSLHGFTFGLQELDLDFSNDVQPHDFPGGAQQVFIVNRAPRGRITIEHPTMAQKDFNALVASGATGSLSVVHGTGAGKVCTITAAQTRLTNPAPGSVRGVRTLSMELEFAHSTALNNMLSIAFT